MSSDDLSNFAELELLVEDFANRFRRGERPSVRDYVEKHPHLEAELRELLPAMLQLEQVKDDLSGAPQVARQEPLGTAPQLTDYRILRRIGQGGMGVVYEAEQISLGRRVAVKILNHSAWQKTDRRMRFAREARAAARLHHTNIVPVFSVGEENGCPYYVMQFIQGQGLDEVIGELASRRADTKNSVGAQPEASESSLDDKQRGASAQSLAESLLHTGFEPPHLISTVVPSHGKGDRTPSDHLPTSAPEPERNVSSQVRHGEDVSSDVISGNLTGRDPSSSDARSTYWQRVAQLGVQVADALEYAHQMGILHRDIKPSNLLLDLSGTVWVADFGLAKTADQDDLTQTGDILGTLRYLPPEALGGRTDERSDLYALGLTLYELLALRPAFSVKDRSSLLKQVTESSIQRLDSLNPQVPRDLATIVMKVIQRDPRDRYQRASELKSDLLHFLNDEPIQARRSSAFEHLKRAARRHPGTSAALLVITFLLMFGLAAAIIAARFYQELANDQIILAGQRETQRQKAETATQAAQRAELEALNLKKQAELTLYDLYTTMGLHSLDEHRPAQGAAWFVKAAEISGDAPAREGVAKQRFRNWIQQIPYVVDAIQSPFPQGTTAEFDPGGQFVLCKSPRGSPLIWNLATHHIEQFVRNGRPATTAAWGAREGRLAVGHEDGVVELIDLAHRERTTSLNALSGSVSKLQFSPDGRLLAICGAAVLFYDCQAGRFLDGVLSHPAGIVHASFGQTGKWFLTYAGDEQVRLFEFQKTQVLPVLRGTQRHSANASNLPQFTNYDFQFVTSTVNESVLLQVWDCSTFELKYSMQHSPYLVSGVPGPETSLLVVPATQRSFGVELLNTQNGAFSGKPLEHDNFIRSCCFRPDLSLIITCGIDRAVKIWSYPGCDLIHAPLVHQSEVEFVTISPDGHQLLSAQSDGLIKIWSLPERQAELTLPGGQEPRPWGGMTPDGRWFIPSGSTGPRGVHAVRAYDAVSGRAYSPVIKSANEINAASVSPSGSDVALGTSSSMASSGSPAQEWDKVVNLPGEIHICAAKDGIDRFPPLQTPAEPLALSYSPDGRTLAILCANGDVWLVNALTGERTRTDRHDASDHRPEFLTGQQIRFSPDGTTFVTWLGNLVTLWSMEKSGAVKQMRTLGNRIHDVVYSPDSKLFATCGSDQKVHICHADTGELVSPPLAHPDWVFSCCFSADGNSLATACRDHLVRLWDWKSGKVLKGMSHQDEAFGVAMSKDGRWLISVGRDAQARLWDAESGLPLALPIPVGGHAYRIHLTANDHHAIICTVSNKFPLLDLEPLTRPLEKSHSAITLQLLADIHAGQSVTEGTLVNLTSTEWYERWLKLSRADWLGAIAGNRAATPRISRYQARRLRVRGDLRGAAEMLESLIQESDRAAIIQSLASEPDAWSEVLRELTRLRPESKECRRDWIDYELARGNWKIAAEGLADYTGMTPQENYQRLYQLATLQAALQDVPAHREVCTQLFEKYAPLFPESAPFCEQISKSSLLLPGSPKEIERACQLALRADEVAGTSSTNFWIVVNRALAHYRRGEFDRAVEQADRSLNMPGIGSSPMQAQAFAVKAMSQQRQGDSEAARKLLVLAQSRLSTNAPAPLWGRPYDHNWSDWLRGEIVVQEAEKLINP